MTLRGAQDPTCHFKQERGQAVWSSAPLLGPFMCVQRGQHFFSMVSKKLVSLFLFQKWAVSLEIPQDLPAICSAYW